MPPKPKPEQTADPYETAVGLLARREHSRGELARKLGQRGLEPARIDEALDTLEAERLLSDERFAEQFVRGRVQRGSGPMKIRAELRQRNVADAVVEVALEGYADEWPERIRDVRHKRFGGEPPAEYRERARQARFLQTRGFTSEQIARVLRDE